MNLPIVIDFVSGCKITKNPINLHSFLIYETMKLRRFYLIILTVVAFIMLGVSAYCCSLTLVNGWWIVAIALLPAVATCHIASGFWHRFLKLPKVWQGALVHVGIVSSAVAFLILGGNYFGASADMVHRDAEVIRKYSEERTRTRRISRRVYGAGEKYRVYYIDVRFDSGRKKDFMVSLSRYNRLRVGDKCGFSVANGLFGMPVIKETPDFIPENRQRRRR